MASNLSGCVMRLWKSAMMEPSYSSPKSVFVTSGEKVFQMIVSQILMAMKSEIPEFPSPYPLLKSSSRSITTTPAKVNWIMINNAFPAPICE